MKQLWSKTILIFTCILTTISGCNVQPAKTEQPSQDKPINLVYYTIGTSDNDLKLVNNEINQLLQEKINVTIDYRKISYGDYQQEMTAIINSGGEFDIAFAYGDNFLQNAQRGVWLQLDDYLQNEGKEMYDVINPLYWEGMRIDGKIYGVPTNKELATPEWFMYSQDLVDKYDIDITKYNSLESLEPILKFIHEKEPSCIPFELDSSSRNFFAIDGYEYVLGNTIPLIINSKDDELKIKNIADSEYGNSILTTLRKYYVAGYINTDASLRETGDLIDGEKTFSTMSSGGPYSNLIWSRSRRYSVVARQVSDTTFTTECARGSIMAVNSRTKYPSECIKFLNCLNTDKEVRNTFNFGIENKHYTLTDQGQVEYTTHSNDYTAVQYTQGNWFILYTTKDEPLDKWDQFRQFNSTAVKSHLLGFSPDLTYIDTIINKVAAVWTKYYPLVMTGSVDFESYRPTIIKELKNAGIDTLSNELQSQIDKWKKGK